MSQVAGYNGNASEELANIIRDRIQAFCDSSRPASSTRWHSSTLEDPPQTKTLTRSFYSDSGNEVMGSSYKTLKLITY
jgi:hypothetical protein